MKNKKVKNVSLDDKLIELCRNSSTDEPEWASKLYDDVMRMCGSYMGENTHPGMGRIESLAVTNQTFHYFDIFMRRIKVSEDAKLRNIWAQFQANEKRKKIYIAGKITGLEKQDVQTKFGRAEKQLKAQGYDVINPTRNGIAWDADVAEHLIEDINLLNECDALYLLPDWYDSRGAIFEKNFAHATGKEIIFEVDSVFADIFFSIKNVMNVSADDMINKGRQRQNVFARMIFTELAMRNEKPICEISQVLKKNHSTVIHYRKTFNYEVKFNKDFIAQFRMVEKDFENSKKTSHV